MNKAMYLIPQSWLGLQRLWQGFLRLGPIKRGLIVAAIAMVVIVCRRPELMFHAQFWAEDGIVYYGSAYNNGLPSLLYPQENTLHIFIRGVALLTTWLPLKLAPLTFNIIAVAVMALPLFILWSDPNFFKKLGDKNKLILTVLYLLIPNIAEIFGNLTNTQWFLAIAAILVLTRTNKQTAKRWLWFDLLVLAACGLTGPYVLVLTLPALYLAFIYRTRPVYLKTALILALALLQVAVYMRSVGDNQLSITSQVPTVVRNYDRPIEMTGMRFVVLPILGSDAISTNHSINPKLADSAQLYMLGMIALVFILLATIKGPPETKALIAFCLLVYAMSLLRAYREPVMAFWDIMQFSTFGERYFFIPFFGWLVALVTLAGSKQRFWSSPAWVLLGAFLIFLPLSFKTATLPSLDFGHYAQDFQRANRGTQLCIPVNPGGANWAMCLNKK